MTICIRPVGTRSIYNRLIKTWFKLEIIFYLFINIEDRNANLNSHALDPIHI